MKVAPSLLLHHWQRNVATDTLHHLKTPLLKHLFQWQLCTIFLAIHWYGLVYLPGGSTQSCTMYAPTN